MAKQFAVLGLGSFGFSLAVTLEKNGCEVVAVDPSEERVQEISELVSCAICANLHDENLMKTLGARNLDGAIVATSDNLDVSILLTMHAKEAGVPMVIAKAKSDMHARILKKLGADRIVFPERDMGSRIAKFLSTRNFADWIELSPDYSMVEAMIPEKWIGKNLRDLDVRRRFGINVVGLIREKKVIVNVDPNEVLVQGDMLIIIGENQVLSKFSKGKL